MTTAPAVGRAALDRIYERADAGAADVRGAGMPRQLEDRYGGRLAIDLRAGRPTVVANFVTTLDGIVAFGEARSGGGVISGFHEPDRFVMGLLRTLADAVVVGAGTLRGSTDHQWTPAHIHPESAAATAEWRRAMGLPEHPTTVIVTGSGDLPPDHAGLIDPRIPIVVATTARGADRLARAALGDHVRVEAISAGSSATGDDIIALGARLSARLMLCEGGPRLLGQLVAADLVDELFLTLSPQLVGRGAEGRLGLVEGVALPPDAGRWHELMAVRRSGDHVLLRYRRRRDDRPQEDSR